MSSSFLNYLSCFYAFPPTIVPHPSHVPLYFYPPYQHYGPPPLSHDPLTLPKSPSPLLPNTSPPLHDPYHT